MRFSMQNKLDPDTMEAYVHNQRHALDYLVAKGHITINKTSVIRLNEHGLLCADGDEIVPEETLRKEPRLFQAGADAGAQQAIHSSLLDSLFHVAPLESMDPATSYSTVISILDSLPKATHIAWKALRTELRATHAHKRSKSALREAVEEACEEDDSDWKAFEFFTRACEDGPKFINIQQTMKTLYRLVGVQVRYYHDLKHAHPYGRAELHDAETADAIFLVLGILQYIQSYSPEESGRIYLMLRTKCRHLESLLLKTRVTHQFRRFMELHIDQTDGNDVKEESDEEVQEKLQPKKRRRCVNV